MVRTGGLGVRSLLLQMLLCCVSAMSQAGPPSTMTSDVAFVEHRGESRRAVLLRTGTAAARYLSAEELEVSALAWSPRGDHVLVSANTGLERIRVAAEFPRTAMGPAPLDRPRSRWFSPDGQRLAVPRAGMLTIEAVDIGTPSVKFALPKGEAVADLLWYPDGSRLVLLTTRAGGYRLIAFDPLRGVELAGFATDCEALLGWRGGQLLVMRPGRDGQEVGTLAAKGEFRVLRAAREDRTEVYVDYLPATDQLLFVLGTEDPQEALAWFLTEPGLRGERRWLTGFPKADDIRFSGDGKWAVFIDRSRPELANEPGGDVQLVHTATERGRLLMRALPGEVSYSGASIRP